MTELADIPEPDALEGAPHPRHALRVWGHAAAEAEFLGAYQSDRLHHAWLLTGPKGVGKATLAWRLARFLLTQDDAGAPGLFGDPEPVTSLDVAPGHPVLSRMAALSEPRLFLLRRPWDDKNKRHKQEITVDEVRRLRGFFGLSATDGGWRVVIVDALDQLNRAAANAILKLLEEPPAKTAFLLVCHQPARVLPTIRSRCRELRCHRLDSHDLGQALTAADADFGTDSAALAALADGSVGAAYRLAAAGGVELYQSIIALMSGLPNLDRPQAQSLIAGLSGRGAEDKFDPFVDLIDLFLSRTARTGVTGPPQPEAVDGEAALMARLSSGPTQARAWAALQQELGERIRRGHAVNLDPSALLLDMVLRIAAASGEVAATT